MLNYEIVDSLPKLKSFKKWVKQQHELTYDIETTCLYPWGEPIYKKNKKLKTKTLVGKKKAVINTLGFGTDKQQFILPAGHPESPWTKPQLTEIVDELTEDFEDIDLIAQNGKFDFLWSWVHLGVKWYEFFAFDTMLAHYVVDENSPHDLEFLAASFLGEKPWDIPLKEKQHGPLAKIAKYQAKDLLHTHRLKKPLLKKLNEDGDVKRVFDKIIMPCARLFTEVEYDGVHINTSKLDDAGIYLRETVAAAEKEMKKFGELENWGSPQQLGKLLFGKKKEGGLGIPIIERTKKGAVSTSESVIKRIEHPIGPAILKFRGARQQLSFFIEGWQPYMVGGCILHPSFKIHGAVTGRFSCEHPNLQQVPRDKRIRQLITAPEGWTLVEVDLSQIELRIAAELAQEHTMLEAFRTGKDVHWITATGELERGGGGKHVDTIIKTAEAYLKNSRKLRFSEAMEIVKTRVTPGAAEELQKKWGEEDPEMLWKEIRKKAKAVNFGFLYSMYWKKFKTYARDNYGVHLTDEQSEESYKFFFACYPAFRDWHSRQKRYANLNGYVRSLSGRKRRLPAAMWKDDSFECKEAERQAINSPVQSFANDLNLMVAIQMRKEFPRTVCRLVGTVHDSMLVYVKNTHIEKVASRLLEIMRHPDLLDTFGIAIGVPLMGEAKIGDWGIGIDFHQWQKRKAGA